MASTTGPERTSGHDPASLPNGGSAAVARAEWRDPRYDIALRDFGLMLGALTLARLASVYDAPLRLRRR